MKHLTNGQSVVEMDGRTVEEVFSVLDQLYPGVRERVIDENGRIRRFVNVYVNGRDVRISGGEQTSVPENAEISIIPAIAGG
jgi:molybdopterin converting factor small subunit